MADNVIILSAFGAALLLTLLFRKWVRLGAGALAMGLIFLTTLELAEATPAGIAQNWVGISIVAVSVIGLAWDAARGGAKAKEARTKSSG